MEEKIVVYAGTFDPITLGHLDIIKRAGKIFDKIIVAITNNPGKKPFFPISERVALVKECTKEFPYVTVESFSGLLVDFLKNKNVHIILRGLRELSDFEFEFQQATVNRKLSPEIDTVFIMTGAEYFYLSSSIVREIASLNGNVSCLVPKPVEIALKNKIKQSKT